jgi:hypothetical protein
MLHVRIFTLFVAILGSVFGFSDEQNLWLIQQDFVKFGKKEVYEKLKKEMLSEQFPPFSAYAMQEHDSMQYIYLIPVMDFNGLGDFIGKKMEFEEGLSGEQRLPYVSTLNFTMQNLMRFLPECSYVPQTGENLSSFRCLYFYLYSIVPGNEAVFEAQLHKIAEEQASLEGHCIRCWKIVIGGDMPKYGVAVFGFDEKQVKKDAEELELITPPLKNLLRSQKQGGAVLRKDLSKQMR